MPLPSARTGNHDLYFGLDLLYLVLAWVHLLYLELMSMYLFRLFKDPVRFGFLYAAFPL